MAASNATITLKGRTSGRTYTVDAYVPDAVATFLTFNPSGLAASTSKDTFKLKEDAYIVDVSVIAAPTAVGAVLQKNGASQNGATIRWANQLASNPNRPKLMIPTSVGDFLGFLQF